jgi:hypothetical protein
MRILKCLSVLLALSPIHFSIAQNNLDLEYLKLTPAEISKREKQINKSLANYDKLTIGRISSLLEKTYGMNIYHNIEDSCSGNLKSNTKKGIMYHAVKNIVLGECRFGKFDSRINPDKYILAFGVGAKNYTASSYTSLEYMDSSFSLLNTIVYSRISMSTSASEHIGRFPVFLDFLEGIGKTNIKALDATVVFMNSDEIGVEGSAKEVNLNENCWSCRAEYVLKGNPNVLTILPESNRLMPIPHPIIFVAKDASQADVEEAINEEAGVIFAYNKMVSNSIMPSNEEISEAVSNHPELSAHIESLARKIGRQAALERTKRAFLKSLYITGAVLGAPIAIGAALLNPVLVVMILALI